MPSLFELACEPRVGLVVLLQLLVTQVRAPVVTADDGCRHCVPYSNPAAGGAAVASLGHGEYYEYTFANAGAFAYSDGTSEMTVTVK